MRQPNSFRSRVYEMTVRGSSRAIVALIVTLVLAGVIHAQYPRTDDAQSLADNKRTETKLQKIVIPHVDFREVTIDQALDYCRKQSALLDASEKDPARRGVKITVDSGAPTAEKAPRNSAITVTLKNIPLRDLLAFITGLTDRRFRLVKGVVVVSPPGAPEPIITREWKVGFHWLAALKLKPGEDVLGKLGAILFEKLPPPTLVVSPDGKRLIGKGRESELDFLDDILKRPLSELFPSR